MLKDEKTDELKDSDKVRRFPILKKAVHRSYPLQSLLNPLTTSHPDEDSGDLLNEANQSKECDELNKVKGLNKQNEINELNESKRLNEIDKGNSSSSNSSSDEEIATPLAFRSEKVLNKQDVEASQNQTMLNRGFNSSCVRYSLKKHSFVC